jgi:hypothetical protein
MATTPCRCGPPSSLPAISKHVWRPSADQTEYFPATVTLHKITTTTTKNKKKKQNSETLNPQPVKSFSMLRYTEKTGGLQHHQTPFPNPPKEMQTNRTGC